jgi:hypothetical protein
VTLIFLSNSPLDSDSNSDSDTDEKEEDDEGDLNESDGFIIMFFSVLD